MLATGCQRGAGSLATGPALSIIYVVNRRWTIGMCRIAQTFRRGADRIAEGHLCGLFGQHMLLTIGFLLTLASAVIMSRLRVQAAPNSPDAGWMSEQWLAEHRASHGS